MDADAHVEKGPWYLFVIFLLLASGIGLAGYLYYIQEKEHLRRGQELELRSIADLKAGQIAAWLHERRADAEFLQFDPQLVQQTRDLMAGRPAGAVLSARLASLQRGSQYSSVSLLRPDGTVVRTIPDSVQVPATTIGYAFAAARTRTLIISDLFVSPGTGRTAMSILVPVTGRGADSAVTAVVALAVDPDQALFPVIRSWPTQNTTVRTDLVRADSTGVTFLNARSPEDPGAFVHIPPGTAALPASIVVRGKEGIEEGIDLRQVPVIATLRQVAGSAWYLVVTVDRDDLYRPIRERALWIGLLVVGLIATSAMAVASVWRHQRMRFYQRQLDHEMKQRALERHYASLTRFANDIILLMDADGRIVDANDRALSVYGYAKPEMLALRLRDLVSPDADAEFTEATLKLTAAGGHLHESTHRKKDGSTFPVEVSSRLIRIERATYTQAIIRDITERKASAEALRRTNTFLRNILESSSAISIISTDLEGTIVFWNTGAEKILGFTAEEMVDRQNINVLYEPGDSSSTTIDQIRHEVQEHRRSVTVELRERTKDGRVIWVKLTASPRFNEAGEVEGILGIGEDITERKSAEQATSQAERELRLLAFTVNCARDCFCVTDLDGQILFTNQSLLDTYGYAEEELQGRNVAAFFPAGTAPEIFATTRAGGFAGEVISRKKDGTEFPIELWTSVVRNDEGGPVALLAVARDISARKHTEEALSLQTAYFEQLFENSPQAIIIVDPSDRIINVNPAFETLFQYRLEEARGRSVNDLLVPEGMDAEGSSLSAAVLGGNVVQKETVRRRKDGEPVDVSILGFPIQLSDKQIAVYGVYTDIAERKRAERIRSVLYKISQAANAADNLRELYRLIHGILGEAMAVDNFYIALFDPRDNLIQFPYFVDQHDAAPAPRTPGRGLTEYVLRTGQPLFASPAVFEHLVRQGEVEPIGADSIDWVGVPLKVEDRVIGVMVAQSYTERARYTQHDAELLKFVSSQVAMAIERKTAEEALRENEQRYRALYNNTPVMLHSIDREGRLVSVSDYWLSVMGYERGEVIGRPSSDFLSPASRAYARETIIPEFMHSGRCKDVEYQFVKKSGEVMDTLLSAISETDARGNLVRSLAVTIDITARKRMEEQLRESKESALAVLNATAETLILTDTDGAILAVNETGAARLRRTSSQLIGANIFDLLPPELAARRRSRAQEVIRSGVPARFEDERDGIHFDTTIYPVANEEGKVTRTVIFGQDITKRKVAEEKLRTLSQAVEQSPTSILITDVQGNIEYVNPKFTRVAGYTAEEVIGKNPRILKSGRTSPAVYKQMWETITSGREWLGELQNRKKSGELFWEFASISAVRGPDGTTTHYLAVKEDITDRKVLEEQLRQAQKMESLGTLAGGIAHDVNNILAIILGHASMMERKGTDPARLSASIEAITRAVNRGTALVRQLLTFARKTEVQVRAVDVNSSIEELVRMLEETFQRTVAFSLRLDRDLPPIVADGSQLHQCLLNLCVNARDAMHSEGSITISTALVPGPEVRHRFAGAGEDPYVCISVRDTGSGMDERTLSRIFEPFFTTKGVGKGTGLGLAVVYGVVNSHHGFVDVESEPGCGTTFRLYFPTPERVTPFEETPAEEAIEPAGGTETILLVEDEEMLCDLVKGLLEAKGYTVITATDGMQAISLYRRHRDTIALVLTDLGLPKLGGWEAAEQMMVVNPAVRIIVATGYLDPDTRAKMLSAGAKEFIQKPYVPREIARRVRQVLDAARESAEAR